MDFLQKVKYVESVDSSRLFRAIGFGGTGTGPVGTDAKNGGALANGRGVCDPLGYGLDETKDAIRSADCSKVRRPVLRMAW
jgi:hypothetical protein